MKRITVDAVFDAVARAARTPADPLTHAPAVFLDRDGTMMHDAGYLSRLEDLRWFPWTIDAIRLLNRAGFLVCVTTNQGGIGLGLFYARRSCSDVHDEMTATLARRRRARRRLVLLSAPSARGRRALRVDCDCRKPRPGMIHQAAAQFAIDLARSFVVGDKLADVGLATSVGARGMLVRTGYGEAELVRGTAATVPGAALRRRRPDGARRRGSSTQAGFPREARMSDAAHRAGYRRSSSRFPRVRLVVAGDLIADEFIYGQIDRVSREAPVLILQLRLDGDRAGRRRQRGEQRRRARRAGRRRRRRRHATTPGDRLLEALPHAARRVGRRRASAAT